MMLNILQISTERLVEVRSKLVMYSVNVWYFVVMFDYFNDVTFSDVRLSLFCEYWLTAIYADENYLCCVVRKLFYFLFHRLSL